MAYPTKSPYKQTAKGRVPVAPTITEVIDERKSMLSENSLPVGYGAIENTAEALQAALPPKEPVVLRMFIIWDNDATTLDIERVLDSMRETGAAMVYRVEQVK